MSQDALNVVSEVYSTPDMKSLGKMQNPKLDYVTFGEQEQLCPQVAIIN